jgi:hypothetical protein
VSEPEVAAAVVVPGSVALVVVPGSRALPVAVASPLPSAVVGVCVVVPALVGSEVPVEFSSAESGPPEVAWVGVAQAVTRRRPNASRSCGGMEEASLAPEVRLAGARSYAWIWPATIFDT